MHCVSKTYYILRWSKNRQVFLRMVIQTRTYKLHEMIHRYISQIINICTFLQNEDPKVAKTHLSYYIVLYLKQ